jgi:hypothetical protein
MAGVTTYNQKTADAICERLANGESLRSVCRDPKMPDKRTVLRWLISNESFRTHYAESKDMGIEERFESMEEDVRAESDTPRARLIWDMRRWELSKLAPKKYGEKIQTELTGADGGAVKFEGVTDKDLDARIAALSKKLGEVK